MKLSASLLALHLFDTTAFRSFSIMSKRSVPTPQAQSKRQRSLTGFFAAKSSSASSDDTTSATALSSTTSSSSSPSWRIFCDLDGVLVDFNSGVKKLFNGRSPDELPNQGMMWGAISKSDQFYANLPWTEDGKVLWDAIKNHETTPDILTGVPRHNKSRGEKFSWCKRELGMDCNHVDMAGKRSTHELVTGRRRDKAGVVNVITCWSRNKHEESKQNHVLIDDRLSLRDAWEERGGLFIHHTSAERTLTLLREKGVLEIESKTSLAGAEKAEETTDD